MAEPATKQLIRKGQRIYEERLKAVLEPEHMHKFVAIEPESGDYFLGRTLSEAINAMQTKFPDRLAYAVRVGHRTAVEIGAMAL